MRVDLAIAVIGALAGIGVGLLVLYTLSLLVYRLEVRENERKFAELDREPVTVDEEALAAATTVDEIVASVDGPVP